MTGQQWTAEALQLLDVLTEMGERIDVIQYRLYRRLGWKPSAAQIREALQRVRAGATISG
jgi:hypothetical protein